MSKPMLSKEPIFNLELVAELSHKPSCTKMGRPQRNSLVAKVKMKRGSPPPPPHHQI